MNALPKSLSFFFWEGLLYILLGFLILIKPLPTSLLIELMIGAVLLIAGIIQLIRFFELQQSAITVWPFLLDGIVSIITGLLLLFYPFEGLAAITTLIVIYFAIKAILEFIAAIVLKIGFLSWWLIANSLILAFLVIYIWKNWSDISTILLGLLVGINLLSAGIMRLIVSAKDSSLFKADTH